MRREFPKSVKVARFEHAKGCCESCGVKIRPGHGPHYDHDRPDYLAGEPTFENCRCLCKTCHDAKTRETDRPMIDKSRAVYEKRIGAREKRRGFCRPDGLRFDWGAGRYRRSE